MKKKEEKTREPLMVDSKLRKHFGIFCEDLGIPVDILIDAMIAQVLRKQEIKISTLDINGFTRSEAKEIKRRIDEVQAMREAEFRKQEQEFFATH